MDRPSLADRPNTENDELGAFGQPIDEPLSDQGRVEAAYRQYSSQIEFFLLGVLRDRASAADVLQTTFAQMLQKGLAVGPESLRSWLFRVAFNEAMLVNRRRQTDQKAMQTVAGTARDQSQTAGAEFGLIQREQMEWMREEIKKLPANQRQIIHMRIHKNYKFQQISDELGVPLGTVLSRMQSALRKLRAKLDHSS